MTIERIREVAHARPFRPFTIRLADGRSVHVLGPEFIMLPPTASRTFIVASPPESYKIIDLLMVTTLDYEGDGEPQSAAHS